MEKEESLENNFKEDQAEIEDSKSEKTEDVKDVEEKTEEKLTPEEELVNIKDCLLYTSPSPRDRPLSRMPSSA